MLQDLYLIMNFMKGGDLRYYLGTRYPPRVFVASCNVSGVADKHGAMSEAQCRFYAAEILLAMEEMNNLNLVYRDLKPENILLDDDGHLRVSDFGLVHDLKEDKDWMTSGEAGTRGYLSELV